MTICALDCGFAVLLCFVLRFIFHLAFLFVCIFDSFSVDRLIYLFIYYFILVSCFLSGCSFVFSLCSLIC